VSATCRSQQQVLRGFVQSFAGLRQIFSALKGKEALAMPTAKRTPSMKPNLIVGIFVGIPEINI
jgi:hypothetical protein